ncbi:MAG TPA: FAD binding domain-containing protein [Gaiellaceae bacterium]|nr:FAD binding domain-containing protein [Gaiellaceae bacterium]
MRHVNADANALELLRPDSIEAASSALGDGSVALAGGTEVVPQLRDGILEAERLVQLDQLLPRGIDERRIGAGTTLAELEASTEIPAALREACRLSASPQLRAMGTIGGNLLQATRCWYWRLHYPCRLHGGERCFAREGVHREHAIFGNGFCASAHPSDPAAALLALRTTLRTNRRELPIAELYRLPTEDDRSTTTLESGEIILELRYEQPLASTYLKAMDRQAWSFALVGVAAARFESGTRLGLAGVAPIPWALDGAAALDQATPLPQTAYKVEIATALVRRALDAVA